MFVTPSHPPTRESIFKRSKQDVHKKPIGFELRCPPSIPLATPRVQILLLAPRVRARTHKIKGSRPHDGAHKYADSTYSCENGEVTEQGWVRWEMRDVLAQLRESLDANLYYLSLFVALSIPDICGAIDSENGEASGKKYAQWFDRYVAPKYHGFLVGEDCYRFRCSLLHQGGLRP